MEQPLTPTPPPPSLTTTTTTTYPESIDSSPRSLTTDSWGEDNSLHPPTNGTANPATGVTKLRLMCSSGGHIVPRPHDKSLTYVGGDTRIVVVDRHTTLPDLTHRLSKTLLRSSPTTSFTVKYQLPTEDLDSLISVTTDEDLENMIEEYERINSADVTKSSRIRLFLFPTKPESGSSIGSILESSTKSEDWFLSALNGTTSFSDTSSVNCLLSLDDEVSVQEKKDVTGKNMKGSNNNNNNNSSGQDVHSVPDLERTSSFGSASSAPSLGSLPPIKVHVDDNQVKGIEEQLTQMSVQQPAPVSQQVVSRSSTPVATDTVLSDGRQKQAVIYQDQVLIPSDNNNRASDPNNMVNIPDQNTRIQIQQQVTDSAYVMSMPNPQNDPQHPQMHHQQPQFIVPPPQYIHHHPSGAVPMTSYYQVYPSQSQHHPPIEHQNFVYYVPARPAPHGYNLQMQHHTTGYAEVSSAAATAAPLPHSQPPPSAYSTARTAQTTAKGDFPSQYVQVPSSQPPQFVGYSQIHHPTQSVANSGAGYGYEFTEPPQGQAIYYAAQPLPPHQTVTSESGAPDNNNNNVKQQQGRTQQA